jgi:hypothetical protein
MRQYSFFRIYQYSSFHTYVDCHVTKSKVQAGAVTNAYDNPKKPEFLEAYSCASEIATTPGNVLSAGKPP